MRSLFTTFSSISAATASSVTAPATAQILGTRRLPTFPASYFRQIPPPSPSSVSRRRVCLVSSSSAASISSSPYPTRASLREVRPASSAAAANSMACPAASAERKPFAVLFVCLGNICRSPAAEGVFRNLVSKKGLDAHVKIDSAGTIGYHEGNLADPRMRAASKRRGIEITSISRPIRPSDFRDFDLILAMDLQNKDDILAAYQRWKIKEQLPEDADKKVRLMCSYCKKHEETEVPDPYYGGPQGFEKVLDLLEDACSSLLDCIISENSYMSSL